MLNCSLAKAKVMENQIILGIDISSATLDLCLLVNGQPHCLVIANEPGAIRKFFNRYKGERLLIGMENTGRYNWSLYTYLKMVKEGNNPWPSNPVCWLSRLMNCPGFG